MGRRILLACGIVSSVLYFAADILMSIRYEGPLTGTFGSLLIPRMLLWTVAMMTPYRLLMTWVYTHTRSVLVAMLMHAGFTGGQALLNPTALSPVQNLLWYAIFASTLWVLAAVVIVRGRRSRFGEEPEPVERAA